MIMDEALRLANAKDKSEQAFANVLANNDGLFKKLNEDALGITFDNCPSEQKYQRFIKIADEAHEAFKPEVACKKGCSHCCNISVLIFSTEAKLIESVTGRTMNPSVADGGKINHTELEKKVASYFGVPCTFLVDNQCSIYEHRPIACRTYVNLGDPFYCDTQVLPENSFVSSPDLNGVGVLMAASFRNDEVADIREFFGAKL